MAGGCFIRAVNGWLPPGSQLLGLRVLVGAVLAMTAVMFCAKAFIDARILVRPAAGCTYVVCVFSWGWVMTAVMFCAKGFIDARILVRHGMSRGGVVCVPHAVLQLGMRLPRPSGQIYVGCAR